MPRFTSDKQTGAGLVDASAWLPSGCCSLSLNLPSLSAYTLASDEPGIRNPAESPTVCSRVGSQALRPRGSAFWEHETGSLGSGQAGSSPLSSSPLLSNMQLHMQKTPSEKQRYSHRGRGWSGISPVLPLWLSAEMCCSDSARRL